MMYKKGFIYKIENKVNGKMYIGKTVDINRRKREHYLRASRKSGRNLAVHYAMRKYGIDNFEIDVIEKVDINNLGEKEKYWINYYNTKDEGYNCTEGGEDFCGESHPFYGKHHSDETKEKLRKIFSGKGNPMYGVSREFSEEHKNKISIANKGGNHSTSVLNKRVAIDIIKQYYETDKSQKELANKYDVAQSIISAVLLGKHWTTRDIVREDFESSGRGTDKNKRPEFFQVSGKDNPRCKTNKNLAYNVLIDRYKNNYLYRELEDKYNVSRSVLGDIIKCKHWTVRDLNIEWVKNNLSKIQEEYLSC